MGPHRRQPSPSRRWRLLLLAAVAVILPPAVLTQAAAAPSASSTALGAERLSSALDGAAGLARSRLGPGASGLARALPPIARRLGSLREPAATTEEQLRVALAELQQMSPLRPDPHYLPALIAVGRAYSAASGSEPLTGAALDPEYAGLGPEVDWARAAVSRSAARAARLSRDVRSLAAELSREKRRAARLARALKQLGGAAGPRG